MRNPFHQKLFKIARPGIVFLIAEVIVTVAFAVTGMGLLVFFGLVATGFTGWFFRDPERTAPDIKGSVLAPADGKVIKVEQLESAPYYQGRCSKISIFMSVFNVHVNRIPCDGTISGISYNPGKFFSANLDKASKDNEHNAVTLMTDRGKKICFIQIAGLIARRIICGLDPGDRVKKGRRFGMICFGSRLDVYLPERTRIQVEIGQKVHAGTTVLGILE
jgi:phosphatidylserine decarboxylase